MIKKIKYLVRPKDFHIFELDETNGCYRSWRSGEITDSDEIRPKAYPHFTFENLTKNYNFFPIDECELKTYEKKNKEYHEFISWQCRPDGHGGSKGGTYEEYLKKKESL